MCARAKTGRVAHIVGVRSTRACYLMSGDECMNVFSRETDGARRVHAHVMMCFRSNGELLIFESHSPLPAPKESMARCALTQLFTVVINQSVGIQFTSLKFPHRTSGGPTNW